MEELTVSARRQFPSLNHEYDGRQLVFFDNPGGTQVPQQVIDAVSGYYREANANTGGYFETSRRTDEVIHAARQAMADLLNAPEPDTIVFGPNMTSLTFQLARSIAHTIRPGDEIVVSDLDHDANIAPWLDLQQSGAVIRTVGIDPSDCTLDMDQLSESIGERTRLVAITHASNAVGTIPDVRQAIRLAHSTGALAFVDAVQYAPHGLIDVQDLDCDFLACSAYKFFGPHVGILYGKREHMERLKPHKVRPSKNSIPYRWETGTLNHEGLAGVAAAIDYIADLPAVPAPSRRQALVSAMAAIRGYERTLSERLINTLTGVAGLKLYGIVDTTRLDERLPTVAFTWDRASASATAEHLGNHGICCWNGNYYALRLMESLGLESSGGAVRVGLVHYNTFDEIDRLADALRSMPSGN